MVTTIVFDTKPYDRISLQSAPSRSEIDWRFMEHRLSAETALSAQGGQAICIFVNDHADRVCLEILHSLGIKHLALRCAGFNRVHLEAAVELGFHVTRVPAYSPYAVAEHAVGLLLAREVGNKKAYDPRSYLALAETAMAERVKQAASDLRGAGKSMFVS